MKKECFVYCECCGKKFPADNIARERYLNNCIEIKSGDVRMHRKLKKSHDMGCMKDISGLYCSTECLFICYK